MGNSPSQQAVTGAYGEIDDGFDLNAISNGSDDERSSTTSNKREIAKSSTMTGLRTNSTVRPSSVPDSSAEHQDGTDSDYSNINETSSSQDLPEKKLNPALDWSKEMSTKPPIQPVLSGKMRGVSSEMFLQNDISIDRKSQARKLKQNSSFLPENAKSSNAINHAISNPKDVAKKHSVEPVGVKAPSTDHLKEFSSSNPMEEKIENATGKKRKRNSISTEKIPASHSKRRKRAESTSLPSVEIVIHVPETKSKHTTSSRPTTMSQNKAAEKLGHDEAVAAHDPDSLFGSQMASLSNFNPVEHPATTEPETRKQAEISVAEGKPRRKDMATSIAKRTFPFVVKREGTNVRNIMDEIVHQTSSSEFAESKDSDTTDRIPSPNRSFSPPRKKVRRASVPVNDRVDNATRDTTATELKLYSKKHKCADCEESFKSFRLLKEHQHEQGHGDGTGASGKTGRFSEEEVRKLEKYKTDFCRMYDIEEHFFNEMMTESCRRSAAHPWTYDFISKQDFLARYFEVLPNRNRKSMSRFRERNWQNAVGSKDWTVEDDDQIIKLVQEIGPKWVEIGQRMTRTQDAVQQRWKKYLQYRNSIVRGEWSAEETEILQKAVSDAKTKSGLVQSPSTDKRVAWSVISDALNNARTPKQCSDRWAFLQKLGGRVRPARASKFRSKKSAKNLEKLSNIYIEDSDDENEAMYGGDEEEEGEEKEEEFHSTHTGDRKLSNSQRLQNGTESAQIVSGVKLVRSPIGSSTETSDSEELVSAAQSMREIEGRSNLDRPSIPSTNTNDGEMLISALQSRQESENRISHSMRSGSDSNGRKPTSSSSSLLHDKEPLTLSQAFANTQADNSALRKQPSSLATLVGDRPSPQVSPELQPRSVISRNDAEELHEPQKMKTGNAIDPKTKGSYAGVDEPLSSTSSGTESTIESESESESEEEVFGVSRKPLRDAEPASSTNESTATSESESENENQEVAFTTAEKNLRIPNPVSSTDENASTSESENDSDTAEMPVKKSIDEVALPVASQSTSTSGSEEMSADSEDETTSDEITSPVFQNEDEEDNGADESDDSDDKNNNDDDDDDDDKSVDSMEEDTRNEFMESIRQQAEKMKLATLRRNSQAAMNAFDSSTTSSDSDSDSGSIEHG